MKAIRRAEFGIVCALLVLACTPDEETKPEQAATPVPAASPSPPTLPAPRPSPPAEAPQSEAPPPDPLAPTPERILLHTARPGESLPEVAGRYDEAPRFLRRWNRLEAGTRELHTGQRLQVRATREPPPRERITYLTREGESLSSIARAHGIDARTWGRQLRRDRDAFLPVGTELELWSDPTLRAWVAADIPVPEQPSARVPAGAFSIGATDDGAVANAVRIPEGPGWSLRFEHRAWGTTHSVRATVEALERFSQTSDYAGRVRLWSMSRHYGGPLPDHESHQSGRDLDVKLPLRADLSETLAVRPAWIDLDALLALLAAFADTGAVQRIFLDYEIQERLHAQALAQGVDPAKLEALLQYPRPPLAEAGLVRHLEGHADHFHVRFACPPWGVACTDR